MEDEIKIPVLIKQKFVQCSKHLDYVLKVRLCKTNRIVEEIIERTKKILDFRFINGQRQVFVNSCPLTPLEHVTYARNLKTAHSIISQQSVECIFTRSRLRIKQWDATIYTLFWVAYSGRGFFSLS